MNDDYSIFTKLGVGIVLLFVLTMIGICICMLAVNISGGHAHTEQEYVSNGSTIVDEQESEEHVADSTVKVIKSDNGHAGTFMLIISILLVLCISGTPVRIARAVKKRKGTHVKSEFEK